MTPAPDRIESDREAGYQVAVDPDGVVAIKLGGGAMTLHEALHEAHDRIRSSYAEDWPKQLAGAK